jgi:signal transduction histidine kinase
VARQVDDGVEILFSDNGKGISHSVERNLFEPGVSGREGSPGMGLTLVRNIIVSHGGSVSLALDRRRAGAAFRVRLPRKRSRAT